MLDDNYIEISQWTTGRWFEGLVDKYMDTRPDWIVLPCIDILVHSMITCGVDEYDPLTTPRDNLAETIRSFTSIEKAVEDGTFNAVSVAYLNMFVLESDKTQPKPAHNVGEAVRLCAVMFAMAPRLEKEKWLDYGNKFLDNLILAIRAAGMESSLPFEFSRWCDFFSMYYDKGQESELSDEDRVRMKEVGKVLSILRKAAAISPEGLEKDYGIFAEQLLQIEQGKRLLTDELKEKFASAYDMPLSALEAVLKVETPKPFPGETKDEMYSRLRHEISESWDELEKKLIEKFGYPTPESVFNDPVEYSKERFFQAAVRFLAGGEKISDLTKMRNAYRFYLTDLDNRGREEREG